jgi:hypothetical protein
MGEVVCGGGGVSEGEAEVDGVTNVGKKRMRDEKWFK